MSSSLPLPGRGVDFILDFLKKRIGIEDKPEQTEEEQIPILESIISQEEGGKPLTREEQNEKLKELLARFRGEVSEGVSTSNLNTALNDLIFRTSTFTPFMREVIEVIEQSYHPEKRPDKLSLGGLDELDYKKELSTGLYSHYENDKTILLSVHGADDIKLNKLAINQFINPNMLVDDIQQFCNKYAKVRLNKKEVYIVGHSMAYWLTASCSEFFNDRNVKGLFASGFSPNSTSAQIFGIAKSPKVKKLLFTNDWLATNTLKVPGVTNVMVFKPYDAFSNLNGHSINVYRKSPEVMNGALERFIP